MLTIHLYVVFHIPNCRLLTISHPLLHWGDELIATRPKISKRHSVHHSVSDCTNTFLALGVVVFVVCSICSVCCFGSGRLSVGLFHDIEMKLLLSGSCYTRLQGMIWECFQYVWGIWVIHIQSCIFRGCQRWGLYKFRVGNSLLEV